MKENNPLRVGYVCGWEKDPRKTWSGTTLSLYEALCALPETIVDTIDVTLSDSQLMLHKMLHARKHNGRKVSAYAFSPLYLESLQRRMRKKIEKLPNTPDVLIEIGDIGSSKRVIPSFLYQDMCLEYIVEQHKHFPPGVFPFDMYTRQEIVRRREWQIRVREQSSGIFAMSQWFADILVHQAGYDRRNIHVVHAGIHVRPQLEGGRLPQKAPHEKVILFVGREFTRKGGVLVVQAFEHIYKQYSSDARLVVAGPKVWPLPGNIPPGVTFLSDANWEILRGYYTVADVFCMPSYFEAFGIVFPEALSFGVPCIGRNDFAMPEMIRHGDNGYLIQRNDSFELAELLIKVLEDKEMKKRVEEQAASVRAYYSWERVAQDMTRIMQLFA